jgi:hypothetical protein
MKDNGVLLAALLVTGLNASAVSAETASDVLEASDFIVDWRVRYEGVDQVGFADRAEALTSRARLGFQTGTLGKTSLLAEAVWIEDVVDDYNSTTNGRTAFPVVADPAGFASVNRFALTNESLEHTVLTLGRQRIILDDARFVGNVGWRQNEQTYDGLRARIGIGKWVADMAYADQVNRIFGPDSPAGRWEGDVVLAHATRSFEFGKVSIFDYWLDLDNAAAASTKTVGVKIAGAAPLGALQGAYAAAFARQSDGGANPVDFEASYYLLELGVKLARTAVSVGHEVLGGNGTAAFSTPLATLHAFQGWADKFLATPGAGLEDDYLKISHALGARGPFKSLSAVGFFHDFTADAASAAYGDEIDLAFVAGLERMTFTLKYASYRAETLFSDTDKLWLSMDFAF